MTQDKGVQASPDGAYPRSGLTVPDLAMGDIIGRGSSSIVRQAEVAPSPSTGGRPMTVAVKIMDTVHNPELRKQLLSELHLLLPRLQAKSSPYIARIFEVPPQPTSPFHGTIELGCMHGTSTRYRSLLR